MSDEQQEQPASEPKTGKRFFEMAKEKIGIAGKSVVDATKKTGSVASSVASSVGGTTKQVLDKAAGSAKTAASAVGDGMDVVSGKKILELVEERLELQSQYNDVLATKLEEALQRIAVLEQRDAPQ